MIEKIKEALKIMPGRKAKELAKYLRTDKSALNSILYANVNIFSVDSEKCWHLKNHTESCLSFWKDKWVNDELFETCLFQTGCLITSPHNYIRIKIPEKCKLLMSPMAKLLSLCNQLSHNQKKVVIDMSDCRETARYFDRAGFFDQLSTKITILPERPVNSKATLYRGNSDSLVEFGFINPTTENKDLVLQLVEKFIQQTKENYRTTILTIFSEFIGNVYEHSQAPINGFAALQKYRGAKNNHHIQTVISDSGLGICKTLRTTLQDHHPDLYKKYGTASLKSNIGLLIEVMKKGGISRHGPGRGLGFKSSREQAMKFRALYSIRQEDFIVNFHINGGVISKIEPLTNVTKLQGTHICFDFFIDAI